MAENSNNNSNSNSNSSSNSNSIAAHLLDNAIPVSEVPKDVRMALRKGNLAKVQEAFENGTITPVLGEGEYYTSPLLLAFDEFAYRLKQPPNVAQKKAMIDYLLSQQVPVNLEDGNVTHAITNPVLEEDWDIVLYLLQKGGKGAKKYLEEENEFFDGRDDILQRLGEPNTPAKQQLYRMLQKLPTANIEAAAANYKTRAAQRASVRETIGAPFTVASGESYTLPPNMVKAITEAAYGPRTASGALERKQKTRRRRNRRNRRRNRSRRNQYSSVHSDQQ